MVSIRKNGRMKDFRPAMDLQKVSKISIIFLTSCVTSGQTHLGYPHVSQRLPNPDGRGRSTKSVYYRHGEGE